MHAVKTEWFGVISLIIACMIGSLEFPKNFMWFFDSSVSFAPDLLSGLIALLALFPLWKKGELAVPFRGTFAFAAILPLFYLTAVLVNIGLGGAGPSLLKLPVVWLLISILLLANLNRDKYAELSFFVITFLATWNIWHANKAMAGFGFPFLAASVVGVVLVFDKRKIFCEVTGRPFSLISKPEN